MCGYIADSSHSLCPPLASQFQEEKRKALVMKAKSERLKKRADMKHLQRAILTQRKIAQRLRRERERQVMRQARDRQDKLTQQKEVEEREYRRQRMARQREMETQQRAKERTSRLLAHIRQQVQVFFLPPSLPPPLSLPPSLFLPYPHPP